MIRLTLLAAVGCLVGFEDPAPPPTPKADYEQRKASAGRDATSQVDLALWCEAHGLERERMKHLAVAVLADPSNAMARGLMGLVEYRGKWRRPEAVAEAVKADVEKADLMAEYNGRRVRTPVKPDAQYKLALWCEEKGLKDEARAHLATVVRLDPKHAEAWKRLGYRKDGNRWVTEARAAAEKAERQAQQEADKKWRPRLERLREALDGKGQRRDDAQRELATITDPRAVQAVWHAFVERGGSHQAEAVQILGQIDAIEGSRALATLAVSARSDEIRRRATETLRRRDPREWSDFLIAMLRDKIKYEVKRVGGPGSPGQLYVEGKKQNLKRIYAPPSVPFIPVLPGDTMETDANGQPVLVHHDVRRAPTIGGPFGSPMGYPIPINSFDSPIMPRRWMAGGMTAVTASANPAVAKDLRQQLPAGIDSSNTSLGGVMLGFDPIAQMRLQQSMNQIDGQNAIAQAQAQAISMNDEAIGADFRLMAQGNRWRYAAASDRQTKVPVGQIKAEADRGAASAQAQLDRDVAALDEFNDRTTAHNARIVSVLGAATRVTLPPEPKPWQAWFIDQLGYRYPAMTREEAPTVVENVPLDYQPRPVPIEVGSTATLILERHSCFGKGTSVRTLAGLRPIEELNVGDLVLTQDTNTGRLGYRPVTVVHHNPPSPTFDIMLGGDTIVSSQFHRFWVAGRGWVMARDLKVGDPIRTLGGVARVAKIETGAVQPVFNLDIEGDADFFAGEAAALVHDNTLPDLKQQPFDAPKAVAAK